MLTKKVPLDRWRIPREEIDRELERGKKPRDMVCLGCAAKVELVSTVYPVLEELSAWLQANTGITLQPREDAYVFETGALPRIQRGRYPIRDLLSGRTEAVSRDVERFRPEGLVLLANLLPRPPEAGRRRLKEAMLGFYEAAWVPKHPFTVGKGHTIQIARSEEQEYLVVDYLRSRGRGRTGLANNDTISTIDPDLEHASWISVFVAMHNALNDLFLCGVHRGLEIYPTVDAPDPKDLPRIRAALDRFAERYASLGLHVADAEPLGFGTRSMGATVVGLTDREVPLNRRLEPGQWLIATRPIGDLAPLTEYLIREMLEDDTSVVEELRRRVLQTMLIPNVEAARIIESYLPEKGGAFDPARHITSTRDMTGPGILAIEELAQDAGREIYLHDLRLHDESIARVEMPNPTSGTNGAIVIGAAPDVARRVMADLSEAGYDPWIVGRVEEGRTPRVLINERLRSYTFLSGIERGIFERSEFVGTRPLD